MHASQGAEMNSENDELLRQPWLRIPFEAVMVKNSFGGGHG